MTIHDRTERWAGIVLGVFISIIVLSARWRANGEPPTFIGQAVSVVASIVVGIAFGSLCATVANKLSNRNESTSSLAFMAGCFVVNLVPLFSQYMIEHVSTLTVGVISGVIVGVIVGTTGKYYADLWMARKAKTNRWELFRRCRNDYNMHPIFAAMRKDLADRNLHRRFLLIHSRGAIGSSNVPMFFYTKTDYPDIEEQMRILARHGFLQDVSVAIPDFIITEEFIELLTATTGGKANG